MFSNLTDFIEAKWSIILYQYNIQTQYFIGSMVYWIYHRYFFAQEAVKRFCAKVAIRCSRITCFPRIGIHERNKKMLFETLISWSAFCFTVGYDKPEAIERGARPTAKIAAMLFRVHMLNSCWTTDVHNQPWLWILKGLCTIIDDDDDDDVQWFNVHLKADYKPA